ncbi:MAG: SMP-30/gluconolactonase/LRE family protein [Acidimicrobiia bacterium]
MTALRREVMATGLEVPEGPVALPDGRIAFVQQVLGMVSAFDGTRVSTISVGPGAPNAVTYGPDGFLYAAQNGGVVDDWRAEVRTAPSIERISIAGEITTVTTEIAGVPLQAPNDLVFGPDGRLYFTDPSEPYDPKAARATNRLFALGDEGGEVLIELPPSYTNGLAFTPDERLVWVETYTRAVCVLEGGRRVLLCTLPEDHVPDGLAIAADGRLFIATAASHGITIVSPTGEILDHLFLDDRAFATNCCFVGSDLWVTDFGIGFRAGNGRGRLWRVGTDAVGQAD